MQTQRDHVHAHQFQMARMSSALLLGNPSMAENPMRRTTMGLIVGVVLALLATVCFGVYGWINPGGKTSWRSSGSIIVEKETGTRYVYNNGQLWPTLNAASAVILNGSSKVQLVSRNSLADTPHGVPVGIPGAPQVLPEDAQHVVRGPWLACLGGSIVSASAGEIGLNLDPGAQAVAQPDGRFSLVRAAGKEYVLWRGKKHLIRDKSIPVALGAANVDAIPAPPSWLDLVPSGDDLHVPSVPGAGQSTVTVDGRKVKVGALFTQATNNGEDLFVLRRDGLAPINRTMLKMLQAKNGTQPVALDAAAVASTPRSGDRSLDTPFAQLSDAAWQDPAGMALCQRQTPSGKETISTEIVFTVPQLAGLDASGKASVLLPSGAGMVVYPVPLPTAYSQPDPYLIAEQGLRYHLTDDDATKALGLPDSYQVPFPKALLETIAQGPALSRAAVVTQPEG